MNIINRTFFLSRYFFVLFFFILFFIVIMLFNSSSNYSPKKWKVSKIEQRYGEWPLSNILILNESHQDISLLVCSDQIKNNLAQVDPLSIQFYCAENDLSKIKTVNPGTKAVIATNLPLRVVDSFIKHNNMLENFNFIIFNKIEDYALVHKYFFTKEKESKEYFQIKIIKFNLADTKQHQIRSTVQQYINSKEKIIFLIQGGNMNIDYLFQN